MSPKIAIILAIQNLSIRYVSSLIGILWIPVSFFILVLVKSFFLKEILNANDTYIIYLSSGLLIWQLLSNIVSSSNNTLFSNYLLLKIDIRPNNFITIKSLENFFIFLLSQIIIVFYFIFFFDLKINYFLFFIFNLLILFITIYLCRMLSLLAIYFRFFYHLINSSLILIFFITPIFWYPNDLPPDLEKFVYYNPIFHLLNFYRSLFSIVDFNFVSLGIILIGIVTLLIIDKLFLDKILSKCVNDI